MNYIENLLDKFQLFCFEQGSQYNNISFWDRIGNMIQTIRTLMSYD